MMGVKSTVELTREEAEVKHWDLFSKLYPKTIGISNEALENLLEKMNDEAHGGEGFENYIIIEG